MFRSVGAVLGAALVLMACQSKGPAPTPARAGPSTTAGGASPRVVREEPPKEDPVAACGREIARLEQFPSLPGSPDLEARRPEVFLRAKADGVIFVRAPESHPETPSGERLRATVRDATEPVKALYSAYGALHKLPSAARDVMLTDGYVYATSPAFAAALASLVRLEDLFREPRIWIHRGAAALHATLHGGAYEYEDGPEAGKRVRLFLFDRVGSASAPEPQPLHRDVAAPSRALGFEELRVRYLSETEVVADLRYGTVWVPSILDAHGARLTLRCEAIPPEAHAAVVITRRESIRRAEALDRLRVVMREQVEEGLPFDEPKTEIGQQDGKLRQHWTWAYRYGHSEFDFNDDRYKVFDTKGRPRVPQVCIDFVRDTFERASGSWFRPRGEPREKVPGRLDFGTLGIDNERSVEHFVEFAKAHPEAFDVVELPAEEQVPYQRRAEFFSQLVAHRDRYRPGDVVTIYGLRDDGKRHYHSFIVYDSDPVTGAPSLVAANAGRPRIRPWEGEMTSAPLRSIRTRIRPRLEWLEGVVGVAGQGTPVAVGGAAAPGAPTAI